MAPITILIADDHPVIRSAISSILAADPDMKVVGIATNGLEASRLFAEHQPDITLMDLNMPIMDGLEAIHKIRSGRPEARIIVLTSFDSDEDITRGLEAGAMGYLLKDSSPEQLLDTIRSVHEGKKVVAEELTNRIDSRKNLPALSPREIRVLQLMMRGKSNRAIGVELGITESTVKSHVKNILIKMGVNDRTQAVTLALQRGILKLDA